MNIKILQNELKNSHQCFVITSDENRRYLSLFSATDAVIIVTKNTVAYFTDSRYFEDAAKKITNCKVYLYKNFYADISEFLDENNINELIFEEKKITVSQLKNYQKAFPDCKVMCDEGLDTFFENGRKIKSQNEIESIKKAQSITEKAFKEALKIIRVGLSEKNLAAFIEYSMRMNGADGFSFETIALCGANTSKPHGVPSERKIENGDFVLMDFGATMNGYHSDMTRVVAVGNVSDEQRKIYSIVLEAQQNVLKGLKAGIQCDEADFLARDIISKNGFGDFFGHSTGHGVGIEIHEHPRLSPKNNEILRAGNVVTVEPGIYLPDKFGVRIEDLALITDDGHENLTKAEKKLIIL